jgi:hypothetical protein
MLSTFFKRTTLLAGVGASALMLSPVAFAQTDDAESNVTQQGVVELTFDHAGSGPDVLAATVEYGATARVAEGWTVQLDAVLEQVEDAAGDAVFDGHDAFVETLSLQYAGEAFTLYAGKINPVFGSAADLAPGLYGVEVGEEYQIAEQLGFGGDILLSSFLGLEDEHVLSGAVFTADRSALSGSLGGKREQLRLADAGLGNTKNLKSWAVSLDGALASGLGYSVGYRKLANETVGETDESTFVAGLNYVWPEESGLDLSIVGEVASSRDAYGIAGAHRDLFTLGANLGLGDWFVNGVVSGWNENAVAGDADLRKLEVSVGRALADTLTLEFGAQDVRTAGESEVILGVRLAFEFG